MTWFWHEADGWRFNDDALIFGPFKTFGDAIERWTTKRKTQARP